MGCDGSNSSEAKNGFRATALSWCLHELSTQPEIQKKLRTELIAAQAEATEDGLTVEQLNNLPYLGVCLAFYGQESDPLGRRCCKGDSALAQSCVHDRQSTLEMPFKNGG